MEDTLYYIGLGLIITFSLIRKVRKEAAKSKSKRNGAPQNQPPAELSEIINELKKMEDAYKSTQKQKKTDQTSCGKIEVKDHKPNKQNKKSCVRDSLVKKTHV